MCRVEYKFCEAKKFSSILILASIEREKIKDEKVVTTFVLICNKDVQDLFLYNNPNVQENAN